MKFKFIASISCSGVYTFCFNVKWIVDTIKFFLWKIKTRKPFEIQFYCTGQITFPFKTCQRAKFIFLNNSLFGMF